MRQGEALEFLVHQMVSAADEDEEGWCLQLGVVLSKYVLSNYNDFRILPG